MIEEKRQRVVDSLRNAIDDRNNLALEMCIKDVQSVMASRGEFKAVQRAMEYIENRWFYPRSYKDVLLGKSK